MQWNVKNFRVQVGLHLFLLLWKDMWFLVNVKVFFIYKANAVFSILKARKLINALFRTLDKKSIQQRIQEQFSSLSRLVKLNKQSHW